VHGKEVPHVVVPGYIAGPIKSKGNGYLDVPISRITSPEERALITNLAHQKGLVGLVSFWEKNTY
jgi:hypothetical protein